MLCGVATVDNEPCPAAHTIPVCPWGTKVGKTYLQIVGPKTWLHFEYKYEISLQFHYAKFSRSLTTGYKERYILFCSELFPKVVQLSRKFYHLTPVHIHSSPQVQGLGDFTMSFSTWAEVRVVAL
jgi:hypothetical protein